MRLAACTWTCHECGTTGTAPSRRIARAEYDRHYLARHYRPDPDAPAVA